MITLLTMAQGNPIALQRTLESFKGICNEVIFGDLCVFEDDSNKIYDIFYDSRFGGGMYEHDSFRIIKFPFNYIFKNGFSSILNFLAANATNDIVIYMNVGETIATAITPNATLWTDENGQYYDTYFFNHPTDPHHWFRMYNRRKYKWDGLIHEELVEIGTGARRYEKQPIFTMVDTEKDMYDPFKAKVYNDIKELVYFNQYQRLIDEPLARGITNDYWLREAQQADPPMIARLLKKGKRFEAFKNGDLQLYLDTVGADPSFGSIPDASDVLVNVQGNRRDNLGD